jgi:nucleotide-binding universal stress UspA family protein
MFDEILACLDGSSLAEKILPLARAIAAAKGGKLTLLRVVKDVAEMAAEEDYLRDSARQYAAELSFLIANDPAGAIATHLASRPNAIAALTTHGRSAWSEAILGSVALRVIREAKRPVLLYCPIEKNGDAPKTIETVVAPLDGNELSEKIISYAVKAAESLSARLVLVQALPTPSPLAELSSQARADVSEASYLHGKAADIKKLYGTKPQWEVLHGDAADAICRYVSTLPNTLLAMTTRARGGLERAILGSVAATCLHHVGVPLLLYWPQGR